MVEDKEVPQDGLGNAMGWILGVFYAEDGLLDSQDPEWTRGALKLLIGLFQQIEWETNVAKPKTVM